MIRKLLLPALAVAGVLLSIFVVIRGNRPVPAAPPVAAPAQAPYRSFVAAAGIVEANTHNIAIGTPVAGVVTQMYVKVGDDVRANDPLFKLDDRDLQAELAARRSMAESARQKLAKLLDEPRPEDIPPAEARVREAEAALAEAHDELANAQAVADTRAISAEEVDRRRYAVAGDEARLAQARADLAELKAGAWKPDVLIAQADLASAEAQVQQTQTDIDRLTVRAPVTGQILQVNLRLGEFAQAGALQTPLLLMGNIQPLALRADIDEEDAWRIAASAPAVAFLRGNRDIHVDLHCEYIEPYVIPKQSLTGDTTERVDTRVLQAVYSFERGDKPIYIGQQMDVFIEAAPPGGHESPTTSGAAP